MTEIVYDAPPTCGLFMRSDKFLRLLAGPVGGGKTTCLIFEMLRRACEQAPGRDGKRRTRFAIVRTTLSQMKMTILLDILSWFRSILTYKVSESLIIIRFGDVVSEWYMIPLEDPEDQKRLLSMQLTGVVISEAIEMDPSLIPAMAGRCGRYPSDVGPTWFGIIADTNMPVIGSEWHKLMEVDRPEEWGVFIQPGGLDPAAENLAYLPQTPETMKLPPSDPARQAQGRLYYSRLTRLHGDAWCERYVHAKYGEDPAGTAVFRGSFKHSFHVVKELNPVDGMSLMVGQDFGRHPCSLICQPDHKGRLLVLEEVLGKDVGLETHVSRSLRPVLFGDRYAGKRFALIGDPSGVQKSTILEEDHFDALKRMGMPAFPATTNNIEARLRAVEEILLAQRDGGPAIVIDGSRCPMLARALNGAYKFGKTNDDQTKPLPEKHHPWSDLADCLQYVALAFNAGLVHYIAKKITPRATVQRPRVSAAGWT